MEARVRHLIAWELLLVHQLQGDVDPQSLGREMGSLTGAAPEGHRVLVRDLISFLMLEGGRRSGGSVLSSFPAGLRRQEDVKSLVRSVLVGLESLGILPTVGNSPLRALWQNRGSRSQISGFLYNISMHLEQQKLDELGGAPWGSLLQHLLSQPSPSPALQLRDVLISLRGSRDWDMLLSLTHSLVSLFRRDQTLLLFLQQDWARLSSLEEALAQVLLTGVLGQGGPGLQGTDCPLTGRGNCSSSTDWMSQLLKLFSGTSWKPRVRLQPAGPVLAPEHLKPFHVLPGAIQELDPNAGSLLQIPRPRQPGLDSEGGSADTLWGALEEAKQRLLRRMGRSLYTSFRRKVSRVTGLLVDEVSVALGIPQSDREGKCTVGTLQQLLLWGIRHNISWNARTLGFRSRTFPSPPPILSCMQPARKPPQATKRASGDAWGAPWPSAEVLESACNDTIPGLPGISNFTVYLYCSLFNGSDSSSQPPSDLGAACSSSAWYFSSASGDSMWVRTCREYFPGLFNTTVCSNASLLQLPSPNQPLMEQLCANLSLPPKGASCPEGLPGAPWTQEDFWSCFLENQTLWTQWLCTNESLQAVPADSSAWISRLCHGRQLQTKTLNSSLLGNSDPCNFHAWSLQALRNASLMEQCRGVNPASFQELVCENSSLLQSLVSSHPWLMDHCLDSLQNGQCFPQRLLDILPISSHGDASRLCRDPASYLLGLVSQLTPCEEETSRWILSMNYLLRLLDFTLPSSELDEVGQAARDQLSEAILLSSLLDNGSFWASLTGNSSRSILQAVRQYLRQERDASVKKELLSCFSPVLWDLIQREEGAPALEVLVQEYLQMPQDNFQQLLLSAESEAVQRFLSLLHRSWPRLQVPMSDGQALQSLASRLMGRFPQLTPQLFVDLSQFMPFMAVSDIMRVPPALLANESVLAALRRHSAHMKLVQKSAFAKLLLQAQLLGDVPTWRPGFLRTIQPLLPHLPLRRFVQLTPQQIQGLADGWQEVRLGLAQGRHVAHSLINVSRGAGEEQVHRLGALACYLSPEELQVLAPLRDPLGPVEQSLLACAANGVLSQHGRVSRAAVGAPVCVPATRLSCPELGGQWDIGPGLASLQEGTKAPWKPASGQSCLGNIPPPLPPADPMAPASAQREPPFCLGKAQPGPALPSCLQVAYALADLLRSAGLAAVGPQELRAWRGIVPELGVRFLQRLSATQVRALLPELQAAHLTPAQASVLLTQAVRTENVTEGVASSLCPLLPGLGPESLQAIPTPTLVQACECLATALPLLSAPQKAALLQRLSREQQARSIWPDCLLPFVPLKLLHLDAATLLGQSGRFWELPWSQQQAQFLWRKVEAGTNVSQETIRALGTLAAGMGCASLQQFSRRADFLGVLRVLYACPSSLPGSLVRNESLAVTLAWTSGCPLHCPGIPSPALSHAWWTPALAGSKRGCVSPLPGLTLCPQRQCVWEEIRSRPGLSREELVWLGPKFLMDLPAKLVDKLPNDSVRLILDYVSSHPQSLLMLPPHRRAALAHRALRLLRAPAETEIPGEVLDLLGPLLGFLGQEAAAHVQPESLLLRLEELQGACLAEGFAEELGRLLLTERVLGPPQCWSLLDVQQLGRLVFLLPVESIRLIPREVRSRDTLEQLLQSQREWEQSEPGRLCQPPGAQGRVRSRKEALVAWLVRSSPVGAQDPVPSCADMRATYPAAWSAAQISSMAPSHFEGCLDLISQDPALSPEQLRAALGKAKQLFGTAQPLQPVHVLQLGLLATQLSEQELHELELSNWGALSVLGVLEGWTARQMRAVVSSFLRQSGMSVQGLALPELAALGHLLCGLRANEMRLLNSREFSQAAPFVGSLRLGCSERQLETLAELLTSRLAFGPVSSWGPEIFTEIGTLAAGLQDIVLSSLIPEQIRALTPLAIAGIPAPKFTVVFSPAQLLGFTSAQASAVTPQQRALLSAEQSQAVVSAQYEEEVAQDGRGRNHARCHPGPSALALLCLMYSFG
ncbi:stereocilin [Malaclemys terrapin pileata]|uniref:stereocilin n=1 Tax=Malaclemys terrapin pileata TaxID=2991368 RepID=UPI0023A82CFF|nr:stereocilin [Malaclemys terrapin pileata]